MNLSQHFTLSELIVSQEAARRGIDNTPPFEIIDNLRRTAEALEEVRALLGGVPVVVSSGYRCPALNAVVPGSAKRSAHVLGLAADFTASRFGSPLEICTKIAASGIKYDQLIHEYGQWVHFGLSEGPMRQEELTVHANKYGEKVWRVGLLPIPIA